MTIWKFPLEMKDEQVIQVPPMHRLLCVQFQQEQLCLWVEVNELQTARSDVTIAIVGTGHEIPNGFKHSYIGTVQMYGGTLVWHIYALE